MAVYFYRETLEECARRETEEETGLALQTVQVQTVVNVVWPEEDCHYIDIVMSAEIDTTIQDQPINAEPEKCEGENLSVERQKGLTTSALHTLLDPFALI